MKAHDLAKLLLEGPNLPVLTPDSVDGLYEWVDTEGASKPKLMKVELEGPEGPRYPRYYPGDLTKADYSESFNPEGYVKVLLL